ncbi:acyltransferase family protein [Acinetobacter gyllenbergii]|uniref:acyltransferase family protein n=1 Tax=Acinetobacter gyllenbergii TaxID=134534 RepID=UPI0003BE3F57|nr:acyltransferase [Acinetobacter gyllenbergii]ESK50177.1 hypothetical protein F987_01613 [Acinetobacter gyllenbergii NIPH 230]
MDLSYYLILFFLIFYVSSLIPIPLSKSIVVANQNPLNGIRGVLASLVMFSHLFKDIHINQGNEWKHNGDYFEIISFGNQATNTGKIGVAIFFMISGFLFYRLLEKDSLNIKKFNIGRIKRIAPLYFSVVLFCTIYIAINYISSYSYLTNTIEFIKWLLFFGQYDVLPIANMTKGVEWTLKLEILLYISIPILFFFFKRLDSNLAKHIIIITSIIFIFFIGFLLRKFGKVYIDPRAVLCFYVGYVAIELNNKEKIKNILQSDAVALASIILFISAFFISSYNLFYLYIIFSCGFIFMAIASGNALFGILNHRNLQFLGEISYSIYLIHGVVLFFFMQLLKKMEIYNAFFIVVLSIVYFYTVFFFASITFKYIESKFHKKS